MAEEGGGGGGTIDVPGVGPTKKVYVYTLGALCLGILGYAWFSYKGGGGSGALAAGDPAADYIGDGGGGTTTPGITTPTTPTTGETPDPETLPPTTNEEWTRRAEVWLTETLGYDSQMIGTVFGKYFARQGLQPTEQDLIRSAWARFGRPPVGDWPILSIPKQQPPPPDTTPPPPPNTGTHHGAFTLSVGAGSHVTSFTDAVRARAGHDVDWGLLERTNPSLAGNINWGPPGSKDLSARTFKQSGTYTVPAE